MNSRKRRSPTASNRTQRRPNWVKAAIAFLLLPLCFGMAQAIVRLVQSSERAETVWVATVAGAACWLVVYLTLPRPMWVYVVGHELTHALWAYAFGGKLRAFKATPKGGHVIVTKNNFVIALAPYFFPVYAVAVVLIFILGQWLWGWTRYAAVFHLFLGAAYAFHLTLTWHVLQTHQSDITEQGYLFSAVVIWIGNAAVLVLGIPLLTGRVSVLTALSWCFTETGSVFERLARIL